VKKTKSRPPEEPQRNEFSVKVKPCWSTDLKIDKNYARQLLAPGQTITLDASLQEPTFTLSSGQASRVVRFEKATSSPLLFVPPDVFLENYQGIEVRGARWLGDRARSAPSEVLDSLARFELRGEDPDRGLAGLRTPQIGAVFATLGFWTTDPQEHATVVMPTGTGKTETILALFMHQRIERLLVLVPTDALRDQLGRKFESYGVLPELGLVWPQAKRPIVGQVKHAFRTEANAEEFARATNVVVATPAALAASSDVVRRAFLSAFTHLFVDEAHHVAASSWSGIRDQFADRKVVQFTATPFREDGKPLKGRIIYAFPLREAQRQKYFSAINYISIADAAEQDAAIATKALSVLTSDLQGGYDHLLMARVSSIRRAEELAPLYRKRARGLRIVLVHSRLTKEQRADAFAAIRARTVRVVICVDMLGEGFDLPELKIAAIHDAHSSLGVTLQFIGRFARGKANLGAATVVVGRPDGAFDTRLHELYQEDADWNKVISDLSERAVAAEKDLDDFNSSFSKGLERLSILALQPKMSAVVYRTQVDQWRPNGAQVALKGSVLGDVSVSNQFRVAWFIARAAGPVSWGRAPELTNVAYDLYVIHWDEERRLLFINSSNTDSYHELLAQKICGESAKRITGDTVYRTMKGIARLVPTNVGILDSRSHARRFAMFSGADVATGFPRAEEVTKTQTNIFALGFEQGDRVSVGASLKGRIWSYRVAHHVRDWVRWCRHIGAKLLDDSIDLDFILRSFIRPIALEERPELVALAAEWAWELYQSTSEELRLSHGDAECPLVDTELTVTDFGTQGPIRFDVIGPNWSAPYRATFSKKGVEYEAGGEEVVSVKRRQEVFPLSTLLTEWGLIFHMEKDGLIVNHTLLRPNRSLDPFDRDSIVTLDWTGIDLRAESQGLARNPKSIQFRVIEHLLKDASWRVVVDDDRSYEAGDIVAIADTETEVRVLIVHCKFASKGKVAAVVEDLYEVCGQAQKSSHWGRDFRLLFEHLARRQKKLPSPGGFARGSLKDLHRLIDRVKMLRPTFSVAIAQPGLSKSRASASQLELLGSTQVYLYETYAAKLDVFSSP